MAELGLVIIVVGRGVVVVHLVVCLFVVVTTCESKAASQGKIADQRQGTIGLSCNATNRSSSGSESLTPSENHVERVLAAYIY